MLNKNFIKLLENILYNQQENIKKKFSLTTINEI